MAFYTPELRKFAASVRAVIKPHDFVVVLPRLCAKPMCGCAKVHRGTGKNLQVARRMLIDSVLEGRIARKNIACRVGMGREEGVLYGWEAGG